MADERWKRIEEFEEICSSVGSFGYGEGWDSKVKDFLKGVPLSELLKEVENVSQAGDMEKLDDLCTVLKHVLHSKTGQEEFANEKYVSSALNGLKHFSAKVRKLASRQMKVIGIDSFEPSQMETICKALVESLHDAETSIGVDASETLVSFAKREGSFRQILFKALKSTQPGAISLPEKADESTAMVRQLAVTCRSCARNEVAISEANEEGLLTPLLDIIAGDDILLQLNVLKLVPLLSATEQGLRILLDLNLVDHLGRLAGLTPEGGEADSFLGDEALRVMSQLSARTLKHGAAASSQELSTLFLEAMTNRLSSSRAPTDLLPTVEMIGAFAGEQPPTSLSLIVNDHSDSVLLPWMLACTGLGDKSKVAGLSSVASALRSGAVLDEDKSFALYHQSSDEIEFASLLEESRIRPSDEQRKEAAVLGKELFVAFGQALNERTRTFPTNAVGPTETVELLMNLLEQPLDEQRCAVFALLRMVAAQDHEWGLRGIFNSREESLVLLMDRTILMGKEAKEWRFSVLEAVFHNPHRDAVLSAPRLSAVRTFLRRGPYLGPQGKVEPQVLMETS